MIALLRIFLCFSAVCFIVMSAKMDRENKGAAGIAFALISAALLYSLIVK